MANRYKGGIHTVNQNWHHRILALGPNLARNFFELPGADPVAIADLKAESLERAESRFPQVGLANDYHELFKAGLDAAVVFTPPSTNSNIAKDCLLSTICMCSSKSP